MKQVHVAALLAGMMCAGVTSVQAAATCTAIPSTTFNMTAPSTGSITMTPLTGYNNYPAQLCVNMTLTDPMAILNGGSIPYTMQASLGVTYNNVTTPGCSTGNFTINGGPVQSYIDASGSVTYNPSTSSVSGTVNATYYIDVNNLNVTLNGSTYAVDTPLQQFTSTTTFSGNTSTTRVCTRNAGGGISATLNGQPYNIPASVWQCINASDDPNHVVIFDSNC